MTDNQSRSHPDDPTAEPVRILIESSEYWLRNNGDLAMLDVTIARLRRQWPNAHIGVLTDVPLLLRAYHPTAQGIAVSSTDPWSEPSALEDLAARLGPKIVGPLALGHIRLRVWLPQKVRGARRRLSRLGRRHRLPGRTAEFAISDSAAAAQRPVHTGSAAAVEAASLLLVLGGGYVADADYAQAHRVFNLVEYACNHDVPVAMVGQGFGPLDDPVLQCRAAEVFPRVGFFSLREGLRGPAILQKAGVPECQVSVTGDDAIELAYTDVDSDFGADIGTDIGVCLRVAAYAPVSQEARDTVRRVVQAVAAEHDSTLVPLIIAEYRSQDRRSTLPIVRGGESVARPLSRYACPEQIIEQVSRCRVLVTGAYHLAVFALSRGIPVVALSSTRYYDDKFRGLEDMFGGGLTLLHLDDPNLGDNLADSMREAWLRSEEVRESLRKKAREQIRLGHHAFERVFALVKPVHADQR